MEHIRKEDQFGAWRGSWQGHGIDCQNIDRHRLAMIHTGNEAHLMYQKFLKVRLLCGSDGIRASS
jgi:hypothetical protein